MLFIVWSNTTQPYIQQMQLRSPRNIITIMLVITQQTVARFNALITVSALTKKKPE